MGIFAPTATLPSGVSLSNVYMSFTDEIIFVGQLPLNYIPPPVLPPPGPTKPPNTPPGGPGTIFTPVPYNYKWRLNSNYKIYTSKEAALQNRVSNIRVPINLDVDHIGDNPYVLLYNKLKDQYPGSYDVIEPDQVVIPPTSNLVISTTTLESLYKDLTGTVESDGVTITLSEGAFNELSDAVRNLGVAAPPPEDDLKLNATETLGE
jgi:hypothetical protein